MAESRDEVIVPGKVLEWGNSYGIRIRKADLDAAGLTPGAEVTVRIERTPGRIDLSGIRFIKGGKPDDSERHDELLGEARLANLRRKTRGASGR